MSVLVVVLAALGACDRGRELAPGRRPIPIATLVTGKSTTGSLPASPWLNDLGWKFEYDEGDRVTRVTDPAGSETRLRYSFDKARRLRKLVRTQAGGASITHEFDAEGRLSRMSDGAGAASYGYDDWGRLNRVEREGAPAVGYTHDTVGRITSLRVGDFYQVEYGYDFLGRLESMKTPAGVVRYDYLPGQGQVVRTLPNGVRTIWKRGPNGELEELEHKKGGALARYGYAHRADGRIAAIRESAGQGEITRRYSYDTMGQLTKAEGPGDREHRYEYDAVGNRTRATATGRAEHVYTYDGLGRLTSVDGVPTSHDASGNLTELTLDGVKRQYRYHADGRLAEARVGGETVQYRYDGFGRLIARKTAAGETRFVPDPVSRYWKPLVIEEPGGARTQIVWDGPVPFALMRDGKVEWLLHDHLGSVRVVTDAGGGVTRRHEYEPFGVPDRSDSSGTLAPGFAGLFWDPEAQTYATLARAYDPAIGRWLQVDPAKRLPLGDAESLSTFHYCGGDPVNFIDRDGLSRAAADKYMVDLLPIDQKAKNELHMQINLQDQILYEMGDRLESAFWDGVASWVPVEETDAQKTQQFRVGLAAIFSNIVAAFICPGCSVIVYTSEALGAYTLTQASAALGAHVRVAMASKKWNWNEVGWDSALPVASAMLGTRGTNLREFSDLIRSTLKVGADDLARAGILGRVGKLLLGSSVALDVSGSVRDLQALHGHDSPSQNQDSPYSPSKPERPPPPTSPSPLGGVALGGAGGALGGLGTLTGVLADANGNLVLVGEEGDDLKLPPLRLDDLVTVFRSVYLHGEGPTVTIDPSPKDPEKSAMVIVHSEATKDTYVGWVLYQADRIMKGYTLGVDNKTEKDVASRVPGHADVLNTIYFGGGDPQRAQKEGIWERFWIVPAQARRFEGPRSELTLFDVPLKVNTQKMRWARGKLVDDVSGASSPGALAFTSWFTQNFDAIAKEQLLVPPPESGITHAVPVFMEVRRIALMTAVAEKLRDQGVPMPFWMRDYEVPKVPFEQLTPSLRVTRRQMQGDRIVTAQILGGVNLSPDTKAVQVYATAADVAQASPEIRAEVDRSFKLAQRLEQAIAHAAPSMAAAPLKVQKVVEGKRAYHVAVIPGSETQALAPVRLEEADLAVPVVGGGAIELVRSYNSFFDPMGPWGRGWALDLPRLEETRAPVRREAGGGDTRYEPVFEVVSPLHSVYAQLRHLEVVPELNGSRLLVPNGRRGEFLALADGSPKFLSGPTRQLIRKDGEVWHFSKAGGALVATERSGFRTVYERDAAGRVTRIVGLQGRVRAATIELEYDAAGHLKRATGWQDGTGSKRRSVAVSYEYDLAGTLTAVRTERGRTGYRYQGPQLVAVTHQDDLKDGKRSPEVTVRRFEYGPRGQVVAEFDEGGAKTTFQTHADATGRSITVTPRGDAARSESVRYDLASRPVEARYADGTRAMWTYSETDGTVMDVTGPDGEKLHLAEAADRRSRTLRLGPNRKLDAQYDTADRLTAVADNGRSLLRLEWSPGDGRLQAIGSETSSARIGYDADGLLSRVSLSPPGEGGKPEHWQDTRFDAAGRPLEITDSSRLQVLMDYDRSGELAGVVNKRDGKSYGFQIDRDEAGRIRGINSSWGKQRYVYDAAGFLTRLEEEVAGASRSSEWKSGLLRKVRQFDGGELSVDYHEDGKRAGLPKKITAPSGLALTYDYDEANGLTEVGVGGAYRLLLRYDAKGRLREWRYAGPRD